MAPATPAPTPARCRADIQSAHQKGIRWPLALGQRRQRELTGFGGTAVSGTRENVGYCLLRHVELLGDFLLGLACRIQRQECGWAIRAAQRE